MTAAGFGVVDGPALRIVRCDALDAIPGLAHGFSTRQGADGSDFDLGRAGRTDAAAVRRQRELLDACGLAGRKLATPTQVHGGRVLDLAGAPGPEAGDAIFGRRSDADAGAPGVRYADCLPILMADQDGRVAAAIHAGWRGSAAGIALRAVEALRRAGVGPDRLIAALGPAIGPCCYEVGDEVLAAVADRSGVGVRAISRPLPEIPDRPRGPRRALDLAEANRLQLVRSGIPADSIHQAPWCTFCEKSLFFSYRREGAAAGRMLACIGWESRAPLP